MKNTNENKHEKKPGFFLIFKILGFVFLGVFIAGIVLAIKGFGDFEHNYFMAGSFMFSFGLFLAINFLVIGFRPEIHKANVKSAKYIQNVNKEDLKDIAENTADITSGAVTITSKAVKDGLVDDKKYCKYCGKEIDKDSRYCSYCGREQ